MTDMTEPTWKLGRIREASLMVEDHGILTSFLDLDYASHHWKLGAEGQRFGRYHLGGQYASLWIAGVFKATGVSSWDAVPGCWVWAEATWNKVLAIKGVVTGVEFRPWGDETGEPGEVTDG